MENFDLDEYLSSLNPELAGQQESPAPLMPMNSPISAPAQSPMPASIPPPAAPQATLDTPAASPSMDPLVKDHLMKKFDLGNYSDENRKKLENDVNGYDLQGNTAAALASLGAAFQGRDSVGAANSVLARNQKADLDKLAQFDKGRANKVQDYNLDRQIIKDKREDDQFDPNSERSVAFRKTIEANFPAIAKSYGDQWQNVSAADQSAAETFCHWSP